MGTISMRGSRSREDSNLRGLAPLLLSGQSHSTALPLLHQSARRNKLVDVFVWISCSRWDSNPRPDDIRFWLAAVGLFATGVDNTPALLFLQIGVSSRMFALQLVFRRASARNAQ